VARGQHCLSGGLYDKLVFAPLVRVCAKSTASAAEPWPTSKGCASAWATKLGVHVFYLFGLENQLLVLVPLAGQFSSLMAAGPASDGDRRWI
jgi:hypothetical protein